MDRGEFIWDRIKHDDALFSSRAEFFLVGQSVLVAAGVLVFANGALEAADRRLLSVLIGSVSAVSLAIWIWTSVRHLRVRDALYRELERCGSPYDARVVQRSVRGPGAHVLMGVVLPAAFLVLWAVLPLAGW